MSTPNMGMTLPTDHDTNDTWGAVLNAALNLVDAHDHSPGKGVLVPITGLNINADLPMVTHAVKDALAYDMTPSSTAAVAAFSSALFTNSADNNLYFRNSGGTNIQITAGNTLNFSVTGGIGGDYTSVAALVDFIDASDTYRMRQQVGSAVQQFARLQVGDIDLFEYKAQPAAGVPANRVRLKSPAALAASYDLTWLAALPSGPRATMLVDSTGVMTAVNTLTTFPALQAVPYTGTPAITGVGGDSWTLNASGGVQFPLLLPVGAVFSAWKIYLTKGSNGATTLTAQLRETNMAAGTSAQIGASQTNAANAPGLITLSGAGTTVLADRSYFLTISGGAGSVADLVWGASVTP